VDADRTHLQQSLVDVHYDSAAAAAAMATERLGDLLNIDRSTPYDQLRELRQKKQVFEMQQAQSQRRQEAMSTNPFLVDYSAGPAGRRADRQSRMESRSRHHSNLCKEFERKYASTNTPVEKMLRRYHDEAVNRGDFG
jgi:hypothetical protein